MPVKIAESDRLELVELGRDDLNVHRRRLQRMRPFRTAVRRARDDDGVAALDRPGEAVKQHRIIIVRSDAELSSRDHDLAVRSRKMDAVEDDEAIDERARVLAPEVRARKQPARHGRDDREDRAFRKDRARELVARLGEEQKRDRDRKRITQSLGNLYRTVRRPLECPDRISAVVGGDRGEGHDHHCRGSNRLRFERRSEPDRTGAEKGGRDQRDVRQEQQ